MKKLLFALLLIPTITWGQQIAIRGVVTDGKDALPGVNVVIKGTTNGVTTDFNGNYELTASSGDVIVFTYLGFKTIEVLTEDNSVQNIELEEDTQQLENVVVQGFSGVIGKSRKRTASIQVTPESVTAFNSDGIEKNGINNITDFANLVPNLKLNESQAIGVNSLIVRGIPQIRNTDAPVAFVIDGVTIADPSLLNQELFDLALIEVVKGPQGALYGKNAIGGAINIYSKEPTNQLRNKVVAGIGNGNSQVLRGISSGALKKDKVFYRVSAQYKNFDGLLTNEFLNKKVDFRKETNLRGQLMFRPTSNFKANITAQVMDVTGGATYYSVDSGYVDNDFFLVDLDPNPTNGNNIISQDVLGNSDLKSTMTTANLEYNTNQVKFQSITSYTKIDRSTTGDLDFTELAVEDFGLDQGEFNNTKTFNQEFRLSNRNTTSKLDWSVGAFIQNLEREFFQSDLTFSQDFAVTDYVVKFNTIAFFGFMDYKLTDKLTASVGLRFDSDTINLDDTLNAQQDEKSDDVLQPKISLSYQANQNVLLYTNYGRGYRAGGFNPVVTDLFDRGFEGELSDNYEFGFKTSSWENRFIFNGSVFYSSYENRQQFAITSDFFIPGNYNYDESDVIGFEIDTKTRLSKYLDLLFSYGQVKSTIIRGGSTGGENGTTTDLDQYNGNNAALVPQNNFNLGLASSIPLNNDSQVDLFINYNGTGKIYWTDANAAMHTSDAYQLLDIQASLTRGNWKLTLWGKNMLDQQYYLEYSDFGFGWRGTPATFGSSLSFSF